MSESRSPDWLPVSSGSYGVAAALAVAAWVLLEVAFRHGVAAVLADPLGTALGADMAATLLFLPVAAFVVTELGAAAGVGRADWDYDVSLRPLVAGVGGTVLFFALYLAALAGLVAALGAPQSAGLGGGGAGGTGAPTWALALFVAVNGVAVPVAEELAWRGVVQTALTERLGVAAAVAVTAVAFVLKHLVVDAPVLLGASALVVGTRLASLVLLSAVLCLLRARYGTASSTVAHVCMNVPASLAALLA
ncbi:CPBP family glutamic-type intramembrane protease [Halobaculum sp. D14]|uniref:CPBP family glutamic-type intramembrane protease n=1 Tax=Halobaculum sp. D14 TaxID=3421642 RepID=UPI003EB863B9